MITNPEFPFRWRLGQRRLNLVSVGGINDADERTADSMLDGNILNQINVVLRALMRGTNFMSRILLAGLSLSGFQGPDQEGEESPGLSFNRYESELNPSFLEKLGLARLSDRIKQLRARNSPAEWGNFEAIGRAAGKSQISENSFSPAFDVRILG